MGRRPAGPRALDPKRRDRPGRTTVWRVVAFRPDGTRCDLEFASEKEAQTWANEFNEEVVDQRVTVAQGIDAYLKAKRGQGLKETTVTTTSFRLAKFFGEGDEPIGSLTPRQGQKLYDKLVGDAAVDTHRNTLGEAKRFLRWCVERRWLRYDPLERVKGTGRRSHGKAQLHADEARRFMTHALGRAEGGDMGALAALCALLLGLRASEIVGLRVRDVDDDGRVLWVAAQGGKTRAARRHVLVPEALRVHLVKLAASRDTTEILWREQHTRNWPRQSTLKLCADAKLPRVTAHGLRGTLATLAYQAGVAGLHVAAHLGHESERITAQSYAKPGSARAAAHARGFAVLSGGGGKGGDGK